MYFKPWIEVSTKYFLMISTHLLSSSGGSMDNFIFFLLSNMTVWQLDSNCWMTTNHTLCNVECVEVVFNYVWLNQMAHCHNKNEVIIYQQNLLFTLINLSPNVPEVVSWGLKTGVCLPLDNKKLSFLSKINVAHLTCNVINNALQWIFDLQRLAIFTKSLWHNNPQMYERLRSPVCNK